ncbi:MAG TPA: hypothetical protein VM537_32210 [Anaerolineae bacterium]|nr:hypothetical protein [Anaerolineae bacterium]
MKRAEVDSFYKLFGQLTGLYDELAILSKKNPNDAINKFKLKFINSVLSGANQLLGKDYSPFDDFKVFDEDDMPRNSDVVLILSQYLQCFDKLHADNVALYAGDWYWILEEEPGDAASAGGAIRIRTAAPKRLRG